MTDNLNVKDGAAASKTLEAKDRGDGVLAMVHIARKEAITYSSAVGSPFTLTGSWGKVATTTAVTKGLRISPIAAATEFDIEWVSVPAGSDIPTDVHGEAILGGDDFASGVPIGDIYLKSATGQVAIVKTGA